MSILSKRTHADLMNSGLDAFQFVAQRNALNRLYANSARQWGIIKMNLDKGAIVKAQADELFSVLGREFREKKTRILSARIGGEAGNQ